MVCVHHIPGRIRLRLAALKRNPGLADRLQQRLLTLDGVERAEVNTLTGSILIRYRAGATDGESLMASIRETGGNDNWVDRAALTALPGPAGRSREISPKGQKLAKLVLHSVAQVAVERSFSALIAAIF